MQMRIKRLLQGHSVLIGMEMKLIIFVTEVQHLDHLAARSRYEQLHNCVNLSKMFSFIVGMSFFKQQDFCIIPFAHLFPYVTFQAVCFFSTFD